MGLELRASCVNQRPAVLPFNHSNQDVAQDLNLLDCGEIRTRHRKVLAWAGWCLDGFHPHPPSVVVSAALKLRLGAGLQVHLKSFQFKPSDRWNQPVKWTQEEQMVCRVFRGPTTTPVNVVVCGLSCCDFHSHKILYRLDYCRTAQTG